MMKRILLFLLPLLLYQCTTKQNNDAVDNNNRPNVIIVLADDLGYNDVGFQGCKDIPTPAIDKLAENGTAFSSGYVTYAVCGPSRAGLLTGRYQDRFGFCRNPLFAPNDSVMGLPLTEETMGKVLQKAGYKTMAIGKWHMGAHKILRPLKRGFDEFFGFLSGGHNYLPESFTLNDISEVRKQYDPYKVKLLKNESRVEENEYLTDALSREAVSFIQRNAEGPFFLYLAYNAPHAPLQATEKYLSRFDTIQNKRRRIYAAMVSAMDDGINEVMNTLETLNIEDNTIVFFLSDNGGPEKHNASDNGPLREGKGSLYEGGVRVPFVVQWPNVIKKNFIYNNPVSSLDIFATVVNYANAKPKNKLDGVDMVPFIRQKDPVTSGIPHNELFWRKYNDNEFAVRKGKLKYCDIKNNRELYDIVNDMSETRPLDTASNQEYVNILNSLEGWKKEITEPLFMGLLQNKEYSKMHPDRFVIEKY